MVARAYIVLQKNVRTPCSTDMERYERTVRGPFIATSGGEAMIPGWREEVVGDYVEVLKSHGKVTPAQVAARLGISECCAVYWLTDLARDGRVRILAVELVEHGGPPAMPRPPLRASARLFARHSVVLQPYHKRDELVAISSSPPDRPLPPGPDFPGLLPVPSRTKTALLLQMRPGSRWIKWRFASSSAPSPSCRPIPWVERPRGSES